MTLGVAQDFPKPLPVYTVGLAAHLLYLVLRIEGTFGAEGQIGGHVAAAFLEPAGRILSTVQVNPGVHQLMGGGGQKGFVGQAFQNKHLYLQLDDPAGPRIGSPSGMGKAKLIAAFRVFAQGMAVEQTKFRPEGTQQNTMLLQQVVGLGQNRQPGFFALDSPVAAQPADHPPVGVAAAPAGAALGYQPPAVVAGWVGLLVGAVIVVAPVIADILALNCLSADRAHRALQKRCGAHASNIRPLLRGGQT